MIKNPLGSSSSTADIFSMILPHFRGVGGVCGGNDCGGVGNDCGGVGNSQTDRLIQCL